MSTNQNEWGESIVPIVVAYVLAGFAGLVVIVTIWHDYFPIPF